MLSGSRACDLAPTDFYVSEAFLLVPILFLSDVEFKKDRSVTQSVKWWLLGLGCGGVGEILFKGTVL